MQTGLSGSIEHRVEVTDTAQSMGSGTVQVLATPRVVALCEAAAIEALKGQLQDGQTTVGVRIAMDHLAPTVPGRSVTAHATLERIDGRTLEFVVQAFDGAGEIATGLHVRVVVDAERFENNAASRS